MAVPNRQKKRCFVICPNPSIDILAKIIEIKANQSNRILQENRYPGGKGIHVALALAELQVPTTLIGFWGLENGEWLIESCKKLYPDLQIEGPKVGGWNRSCYTFQSNNQWNDTELLGTGPKMSHDNFIELMEFIIHKKEDIDLLAVCGSWPLGAKPNYNQKLTSLCNSLKISIFLDCTGEQLKNAISAKPFCVHLNRSELTTFFAQDFMDAIQLLSEHCKVAAITDGSNGLFYSIGGKVYHTNVRVEEVKSAVGSGDCLVAGIMAGFYNKLSAEHCAKLGAASGAANCIREDLGMLYKKDVDRLVGEVKCEII